MPLAHVNDIDWNEIFSYEDGLLYWKIRPSQAVKAGSLALTSGDRDGYFRVKYKGKYYKYHRVIYEMITGLKLLPDEVIDHFDLDRSNNRFENLRCTTNSGNRINVLANSTTLSGRVGVYWMKNDNNWRAMIVVNKQRIFLGRFKNLEDAIESRRKAELEFYGFNLLEKESA